MRANFYVYVLYREDGQTPFYIGKGTGNRWSQHEYKAKAGASHKDNIIVAMRRAGLVSVPKEKLAQGLTDEQAKQLERDLILLIGRLPIGSLSNGTDGGDGARGVHHTSEMRQRISDNLKGHPVSDETRRKIGDAHRGRRLPEQQRQKIGIAHKGRVVSEQTRDKLRSASTGRRHTEESRKKMSSSQRGRVVSEKTRQKISAFNKGRRHSLASRQKISSNYGKTLGGKKRKTRHPVSLETREKIAAANRRRYADSRQLSLFCDPTEGQGRFW